MRAMSRPLIAVAGVADGQGSTYLPDRYSKAVLRAGGLPVIVPPLLDVAATSEFLDLVQGLIIPGGRDLDTVRLDLGPVHEEARLGPSHQHEADIALVTEALARNLPVLGICYGMQLLGVLGGGTLYQHLPEDVGDDAATHFAAIHEGLVEHEVVVAGGTRTAAALGAPHGTRLCIKSSHHQALSTVGDGWLVSATSPDGLIEAIEHSARRLALGVQWHPERSLGGGAEDGLFAALVCAAGA
jgi:putative glutamine amidotransferase